MNRYFSAVIHSQPIFYGQYLRISHSHDVTITVMTSSILFLLLLALCIGLVDLHSLPTLRQFYEKACQGSHLASSDAGIRWSCRLKTFSMTNVSVFSLQESLEEASEMKSFHERTLRESIKTYFVVITVPPLLQASSGEDYHNRSNHDRDRRFLFHSIHQSLDKFIVQHPWWQIKQYPTPHQIPGNKNSTADSHNMHLVRRYPLTTRHQHEIILQRMPRFMEALGEGVLAQAFPTNCDNRIIYLKTGVGSWGNDIIVNMESFLERSKEHVHMIYLTNSGSKDDQVGYVEPHVSPKCASQVDKHTCVFLPTTNCSIPFQVKNCSDPSCIREGYYTPTKDLAQRSRLNHTYSRGDPHESIPQSWSIYFPPIDYRAQASPIYRVIDVLRGVVPGNVDTSQMRDDVNPRLYSMFLMFNIIYRPNAFLGMHMQSMLEEFFDTSISSIQLAGTKPLHNGNIMNKLRRKLLTSSSSTKHSHSPVMHTMDRSHRCHIAHIRMGDRYLNRSVNMFDWCRAHTNASEPDREKRIIGEWKDGSSLTYGQYYDMGCQCRHPFGALTLQHYVNASKILNPNITHLMVVTDDYRWLNEEISQYKTSGAYRDEITLHVFPTHLDNVHRSRSTIQATSEWWAAIEAARHCEAFIGHTSSAASFSVYRAMCFQHGDMYMQCPPWFLFD